MYYEVKGYNCIKVLLFECGVFSVDEESSDDGRSSDDGESSDDDKSSDDETKKTTVFSSSDNSSSDSISNAYNYLI